MLPTSELQLPLCEIDTLYQKVNIMLVTSELTLYKMLSA